MLKNYNNLAKETRAIRTKYEKNRRLGIQKRSLKIKEEELEIQKRYAKSMPPLEGTALFWLGLGLYWAEGAKTERWRAVFYNSNAEINRAMMKFFRDVCKVNAEDFRIQLILHSNINEMIAKKYWSYQLDVPISQFFRASYVLSRSSNKKRPALRLPFGTVQISVRGKQIANLLKGWMLGLEEKFNAALVQQ